MVDIYSLLAGSMGSEEDYLKQDPWYRSAASLSQVATPQPTTSSEAFLLPLLQGAGTGLLAGYGKKQAMDKMYSDYRDSPLLANLRGTSEDASAIGPLASGTDYASLLAGSRYQSPERPASWSPKAAQQDLLTAVITGQAEQEAKAKAQEFKDKLNLEVALKTNPDIITAGAVAAGQEAAAKKTAEIQALQELSGQSTADKNIGPVADPVDYYKLLQSDAQANLPLDPVDKSKALRELENTTYTRVTTLPSYKQFTDIESNFKTLATLKDQDTSVSDVGMITSLNKIFDPNSTTREGEYNTLSKNTQSFLDSLQGNMRQVFEGKASLSKKAKEAMVAAGAIKYDEYGKKFQKDTAPLMQSLSLQGGNAANVPLPSYEPFNTEASPAAVATGVDLSNEQIPAGYELTGRVDANGNKGIRKIR